MQLVLPARRKQWPEERSKGVCGFLVLRRLEFLSGRVLALLAILGLRLLHRFVESRVG